MQACSWLLSFRPTFEVRFHEVRRQILVLIYLLAYDDLILIVTPEELKDVLWFNAALWPQRIDKTDYNTEERLKETQQPCTSVAK